MNKFCFSLITLLLVSCSSIQEPNPNFSMSSESYQKIVESYSDHVQKYEGPYNALDVTATLLNSKLIEAQTQRKATMFQWDNERYRAELQSKLDSAQTKTEVFVSMFTPDRKSGDLLRADTLWKTILRYDGKEIVGSPKKVTLLPIEIASLYPKHSRWNSGYIITFEIPTSTLERMSSELIISGPVGAASLKFKPVEGKSEN